MSDDRQPSYDFFLPSRPKPSGPSQSPGSAPQPSYGSPSSYGRAAPAVLPYYQPQRPWIDQVHPAGAGRNRSGIPTWVIVLIVLVVGLFGAGIMAAIAIPVFLSQHAKAEWESTSVAVPASFAGLDRGTDKQALALAKSLADDGRINPDDIGVYGAGTPHAIVIVAIKLPAATSSAQQAVERKEYEAMFALSGAKVSLHGEDEPGPLGGWLGCGSTAQGAHVCLATDSASLVTMISPPGAGDAVALMREARAQSVTRH